MNNDYSDIISLPRHVSKTHKQMSNSDRAAQFAPFAALTGFEQIIKEAARISKKRIVLSNDQKEKINFVLQSYRKGEIVRIKFFNDGYLYFISGTIKRIDLENRKLILDQGKLSFENIIDIEIEGSF